MKRGADVCKQALAPFSASDTKEPIEEHFQLFNNRLLFRGTVSAAETRNRRHQIVDVRAGRFDNAVTEGMGDKVAGFRIFQVFFLDEGGKLFLFFLGHQGAPFKQHVRCIVDACDEGFNQRLLAAQFWAGIHGFLNRNEHFFIIAVGIVILLDENENVVKQCSRCSMLLRSDKALLLVHQVCSYALLLRSKENLQAYQRR